MGPKRKNAKTHKTLTGANRQTRAEGAAHIFIAKGSAFSLRKGQLFITLRARGHYRGIAAADRPALKAPAHTLPPTTHTHSRHCAFAAPAALTLLGLVSEMPATLRSAHPLAYCLISSLAGGCSCGA